MTTILSDISAIRYWRRLSTRGGLGAVHGLLPLAPKDLGDIALPSRRGPIPSGPPNAREIGLLEHYALAPAEGPLSLVVREKADRRELRNVRSHACSLELPARCIYPVVVRGKALEGIYVSSPELALAQTSLDDGISFVDRLRLAMELCGTYRLTDEGATYRCPALTSTDDLMRFIRRALGLRGRMSSISTFSHAMDGSASPAETDIALSLSLPMRHGGSRLGKPVLNETIVLNENARVILGREVITPDLLFSNAKRHGIRFPVEYESREFHSEQEQATYDEKRRNTYAAMGMACFLAKPHHLAKTREYEAMAATIQANIGKRLGEPAPGYWALHQKLLDETLAAWRTNGRKSFERQLESIETYENWTSA